MNKTNLSHLTVQAKIFAAMRRSILTGLPQYVYNKKGEPFMRINHARNCANAFSFWCVSQKNVTNLVLSVIRAN